MSLTLGEQMLREVPLVLCHYCLWGGLPVLNRCIWGVKGMQCTRHSSAEHSF